MHNNDDMNLRDDQPMTKGDWNRFAAKIGFDRFTTKTDLEPFARKTDLEPFAKKTDLEPFARKTDLEPFARKTDLEPFAKKTDLEPFAKKTDLERFATKVDLERFATKVDLEPFAKKTDLERFATKADLDSVTARLAKGIVATQASVSEINEKMATMMTKKDGDRILAALQDFAGKAQNYDKVAALHGRSLTEAEVTLIDHEKRLRAIERRAT